MTAVIESPVEAVEEPIVVRASISQRLLVGLSKAAPIVVTVLILGSCWELYKLLGSAFDDTIPGLGWKFPVKSDDTTMPHLWSIVGALGEAGNNNKAGALPLWRVLFNAAGYTAREASVGFVLGAVAGVALATVFQLVPVLGRAFSPWLVVSQTIPFVATAPMIVIWGGRAGMPAWFAVSIISAYLVFFPVTVNTARGFAAVTEGQLELMRSYAAGSWWTLLRLRVPMALPYLFVGLRIGATSAVVGAIVGELPSGQSDGVGRLVLTFASFFQLAPERLFAAVAAAALLGITFFGVVSLAERLVLGPRALEAT